MRDVNTILKLQKQQRQRLRRSSRRARVSDAEGKRAARPPREWRQSPEEDTWAAISNVRERSSQGQGKHRTESGHVCGVGAGDNGLARRGGRWEAGFARARGGHGAQAVGGSRHDGVARGPRGTRRLALLRGDREAGRERPSSPSVCSDVPHGRVQASARLQFEERPARSRLALLARGRGRHLRRHHNRGKSGEQPPATKLVVGTCVLPTLPISLSLSLSPRYQRADAHLYLP